MTKKDRLTQLRFEELEKEMKEIGYKPLYFSDEDIQAYAEEWEANQDLKRARGLDYESEQYRKRNDI